MIVENNNPIAIIGYPDSSMTQNYFYFFSKSSKNDILIFTPDEFLKIENKKKYQYSVGFSLDMNLRREICDYIDSNEFDCFTYIDDTSLVSEDSVIGKGVTIGPYSFVQNSIIGNHCAIESYCLVSHHVKIGKNCILHSGSLIAGKTIIGENCTFGFKSGVINKVNICDNVNLGAFSNLTKDVNKSGTYVGSVARFTAR